MDRPTPFDLVFSGLAPEWFPPIRDALAEAEADPRDRDAFLLTLPAMQLLRQLRPDDTDAGAGVDELTALAHHAYLAWADGTRTWTVPEPAARALLAGPAVAPAGFDGAGYLQLPARLVWASLVPASPWEPLDGCFVHTEPGGDLRVLGVFGLHPSRNGFTVAEAVGAPGRLSVRHDGAPLFAPALDGGAAAGLHAIVDPGELVELAARGLAGLGEPAVPPEGR
jgi:hypothetical protein